MNLSTKPTVIDHQARNHAVLAPSAMDRNMKCLAALLPLPPEIKIKPVVSLAATQGTVFHEYMEKVLRAGNPEELQIVLNEVRRKDSGMVEHCTNILKVIQQGKALIGPSSIVHELIEEKVKFSPNIFGTVDYGLLYIKKKQKNIFILDHKYGVSDVPIRNEDKTLNPQLMSYLLAVSNTHNFFPDEAVLNIYQPRALGKEHDSSNRYRAIGLIQEKIFKEEIKQFEKTLKTFEKKALKVLSGETPPEKVKEIPGDHCKYCPRAAICTAFRKQAEVSGLVQLSKLPALPNVKDDLKTKLETKPPRDKAAKEKLAKEIKEGISLTHTDEQIRNILEREEFILRYIKAIKKYALERALGDKFKGFKVVTSRQTRRLIKDLDRLSDIFEPLKITPFKTATRTITDLEQELGRKLPDEAVELTNASLVLVPETDSRPTITSELLKKLGPIDVAEEDV